MIVAEVFLTIIGIWCAFAFVAILRARKLKKTYLDTPLNYLKEINSKMDKCARKNI